MKKFLLASVATIAIAAAAPAQAADLAVKARPAPVVAPPPPAFSWTGCYIGAHTGWGWGRKEFRDARTNQYFIDTTSSVRSSKLDTSGPLFGGQLGCDYQFGFGKGLATPWAFVIGIQGSLAAAAIEGHDIDEAGVNESFGHGGATLRAKTDFLADLTGRLGFTFWSPTSLLYVKGGVAWDHTRYLALSTPFPSFSGSDAGFNFSARESRTGAVVGVGGEWAFAPNWSAFVEWDHYFFGTKDVTFHSNFEETTTLVRIKQDIDTVKVGVNYRFNWLLGKGKAPVVARY